MKPEMKLIIANLPYLLFVYLLASWDRPTGWRLGGLVGKAVAPCGRLFPCL